MTGEYHAHTYESNDAQESLTDVLDTAFEKNGLDWLSLADHLRVSDRDDEGVNLSGGSIPMSQGIAAYQTPIIKQLQAAGKYTGKIIFSGFEWDMPQYDHAAVGIVTDEPGSDAALKAINQFEYLFTNRAASLFNSVDVAQWNAADSRAYTTKTDTRTGIQWISDHYPESYVLLNHPSRKNGSSSELKIADVRDFNNIDPNVVFGFEGMLGNQMSPDRGETAEVFGGTDVKVAKVGGFWDALLGEGRRFWNFANSDFHFKTSKDNKYSSGYWPGEYSKNYTWVDGSDINAVVDGMRSGKSFSVFGDLINALEFDLSGDGQQEEMGGELSVKEGDDLELRIRFKSPEKNNNGDPVQVDHVDLISGEVNGKIQQGTPEYDNASNDTTKVLKRFTSADWTTDADGYNVITYKLGAADKNRYFRLRGTNLGVDVAGETSNGEPLLDVKNLTVDNPTRFTEINNRNYQDLWFYSNPVFVNVEPYSDEQAVDDTLSTLSLGDTSGVTADMELPVAGMHGSQVQWESEDSSVLRVLDGLAYVTRPAAGQPDATTSLQATVTRGVQSKAKTFIITVKAREYTDAEAVLLAKDRLTLGDISSVKDDLLLPVTGEQGTSIVWESSNPVLMADDGKMVFRPKHDTLLTLTATIRRGTASEVKVFEVKLSGDESITPLKLNSTLTNLNGQPYPSGSWSNQSVAVSVYASVYVPGTTVSLQLLMNEETKPRLYESGQSVEISDEGEHWLQFQATDTLGNTASLPLTVNIDRTAPVITLKGDHNISVVQGDSFTDPGAGITDKIGIPGPIVVTGEVDSKTPGTYKMRYNAIDLAGNAAQELVRTVVVTAPSSSGDVNNGSNSNITPPTPLSPELQPEESSSVQLEVTAAQGALGILKDVASFTIPAGALSTDSTIGARVLNFGQTPAAGNLQALSPTVELTGTNGGKLNMPIGLSLNYDVEKVTSGHRAAVYYFNERRSSWIYMGGTENMNGTVTVNVSQFSKYAVFNYQSPILTDLDKHWAAVYTDRLLGMEVMQGFEDHSFRPNDAVTRAQFASIIVKALDLKPSGSSMQFADDNQIPSWATGDVAAAVEAGIIHGYNEGGKSIFKASEQITRAEMSVMLVNAMNTTPQQPVTNAVEFADSATIPVWAQSAVNAALAAGILDGFGDHTFRPEQIATRAEAAATVYKLLTAMSI